MPSPEFRVAVGDGTYDLFGHGGMLFWMASSAFFGLVSISFILFNFILLYVMRTMYNFEI